MALRIDAKTRVRVQKIVETKDNYMLVHLSSSDKRKDEDKYDYSNWSYARLVSKANNKGVSEGDVITLTNAKVSFVAYKSKETGEWTNPKTPTVVVFDFEFYRGGNRETSKREEIPALPPEDDIPF